MNQFETQSTAKYQDLLDIAEDQPANAFTTSRYLLTVTHQAPVVWRLEASRSRRRLAWEKCWLMQLVAEGGGIGRGSLSM